MLSLLRYITEDDERPYQSRSVRTAESHLDIDLHDDNGDDVHGGLRYHGAE